MSFDLSHLSNKQKIMLGIGAGAVVLFVWRPWQTSGGGDSGGSVAGSSIEYGSNPSGVSSTEVQTQIAQAMATVQDGLNAHQNDNLVLVQKLMASNQQQSAQQFANINHNLTDSIAAMTSQINALKNNNAQPPSQGTGVNPAPSTQANGNWNTPKVGTVTANGGLNLRSGPGDNYGVVRTLPKGSQWQVWNVVDGWALVGNNQWVSTKYLSIK